MVPYIHYFCPLIESMILSNCIMLMQSRKGGSRGTYGTLSIIAFSYGINSFITLYCNPFFRSYQSLFSSFIGTSVDRTPFSTIYKRTSLYRCCSWIFSSHFFTIFEPLNSVSKRCRSFSVSIFDRNCMNFFL
jgi:hypothetical protein